MLTLTLTLTAQTPDDLQAAFDQLAEQLSAALDHPDATWDAAAHWNCSAQLGTAHLHAQLSGSGHAAPAAAFHGDHPA